MRREKIKNLKDDVQIKKALDEALLKRALGYSVSESSDEYAVVDGEIQLTKRKIVTKELPPELSAIKLILDEKADDFDGMTEQELTEEKIRLLKQLEKLGCKN